MLVLKLRQYPIYILPESYYDFIICKLTDFGIVNCTKKHYHITISLKPYIGGKARFGPELWALSIYVASPVTSPANSATLINVTPIASRRRAFYYNGNNGNAGDTGFVGLMESALNDLLDLRFSINKFSNM